MLSKEKLKIFTYQARFDLDSQADRLLQDVAHYFSQIERKLFADISSGKQACALKSSYLKKYGITARHFNAIRVQLEGKIESIKEKRNLQIKQVQEKIEKTKKFIKKCKKASSLQLHRKKRLLFNLEYKLNKLVCDKAEEKVDLCFGSRKLFRAQFNLESNGYKNHGEWLQAWKQSRNDSFFLLGSKDETAGNQSCVATVQEDGSLNFRIRLPDALGGKYLTLYNIKFKYGQQEIVKALDLCNERREALSLKQPYAKDLGSAISYRFKKDKKGWRIFVSVACTQAACCTSSQRGVIGVDINVNHLAICETDRFGNPIFKKSFPLNTYGKSRNQAKALIGDTCSSLIKLAKEKAKTIVIEDLDFSQKKLNLQASAKQARLLSSFSYHSITEGLQSKGCKEGVEVVQVNPAYTSIIGRVKFASRYGLSIHQAAALVIGRRYLKVSERIPRHLDKIPDGKNGYVALSVPVRNRDKHVWSFWRKLNQELKTVLAVHFRTIKDRSMNACICEINPNFAGEIPARELVNKTARLAS
jgi:IS605 OrfB family transposase